MNEKENKLTRQRIDKSKSWFFKIRPLFISADKPLSGLIKKIPAGTNNQHQNFKKECHCRKYKDYKKS